MKNTNKHLDDLFTAARQEDPVLSEDNARDLIHESKPMQLPSKLITTKGAIMTSIGFSLAAVTAYVLLSGSPSANTSIVNQLNSPHPKIANLLDHSIISSTDELKKNGAGTKKIIIVKKGESVPTPPEPPGDVPVPPIPPIPSIRVTPPLKVTGITPAALTPDKYAVMGISKKKDGTVSFSQKNEKGKVFTMSFPKNSWGVIIGDDDSVSAVPNPPAFAPLIVTDTKGNKRLMQFTSNANGRKMRSLEINSHSNEPGAENALNIQSQVQIGGDNADIDNLGIGLDSNDIKEINEDIQIETDNALHAEGDNNDPADQKQIQVFAKINKRNSDSTIDGKPHGMITINKTINIDSTIHSMKGVNMDSIFKQVKKSLNTITFQIKNINLDSIYDASYKSMKKAEDELKSINTDSILKEAHKSLKKADDELKRMNLDSILKSATESMIEAEDAMAKRCNELNTLVPILVRKATKDHYDSKEDITYDDGLIFWYDNTKDFYQAANSAPVVTNYAVSSNSNSEELQSPNGNNVIKNTELSVNQPSAGENQVLYRSLIYPNPAKNSTTVRFELSEPRVLAFSIHDLLGKRVMVAGNLSATSAGSFEKELNLSELTAGVYLLVITTDKGEQNIQRLVIQE